MVDPFEGWKDVVFYIHWLKAASVGVFVSQPPSNAPMEDYLETRI